ncbi:MAG: Maf family protein [Azovibrio sp.]
MRVGSGVERIYLASHSPRRRELLDQIGVSFEVLSFRSGSGGNADVDETPLPDERSDDYVLRLARAKAEFGRRFVGWRKCLPLPILAADTTLDLEGQIIGKPVDAADATAILSSLSGRTHRVLTAIAMDFEGHMETALSISEVRFRELDPAEIRRYVVSGEPMDKAGAYGIQGRGGLFVEHMAGSYSGIMGLPLCETGKLLRLAGYPI